MRELENYNLDKMDLDFIYEIQKKLEKKFRNEAINVFLDSSFMERFKENADYIYHYDAKYWANVIANEVGKKYELKQ